MMPPHDTPVIGAINGPTVTGGLELAMCCDFLIASERARFADTHARVGVMPGGGMTIRLPQLVGLDRAHRMSLTGDYIDAETARDWGLVVEVVPHESLLERARQVAATIASIPSEYLTELRRGYDEIGALSGQEAFRAEARWSRAWMADRFDQSRLTTDARRSSAQDSAQTTELDGALGMEGLRGHGPAPQPARCRRPCPTGASASATTACTSPRPCTTPWLWHCWSPSTRSGSSSAPA